MINVNVVAGKAYRAEKRNIHRDEIFGLPEGSIYLGSEIVMDGDEPVVEVWFGLPVDADITPEPPQVLPPRTIRTVETDEDFTVDDYSQLTEGITVREVEIGECEDE